jgi:hypothetical protein
MVNGYSQMTTQCKRGGHEGEEGRRMRRPYEQEAEKLETSAPSKTLP